MLGRHQYKGTETARAFAYADRKFIWPQDMDALGLQESTRRK